MNVVYDVKCVAETKGWIGVPVRQYIGITMVSLNPDIAAELKMINTSFPDVEQGVLVYRVISGSPACKSVHFDYWICTLYIVLIKGWENLHLIR